MSDSTRYIVEDIFTRNRLHLIFGPPRSGCSTLLHQIMWDWSQSRDVLGHKSYPSPFCLIDTTRPVDEIRAQLQDLEIPYRDIPHISMMENTPHEERTIDAVFRHAKQSPPPNPQVIFLDGLQALFHGNVIHYKDVLNFTIDVSNHCLRDRVTIVATLNTSKSLEGSDTPILQRVMGSTAWLKTAGTLLHIAPRQGQDLEPARVVSCFVPRRQPVQSSYIFTPMGKLEYKGDATLNPEMDTWLQQITPGAEFPVDDIYSAADQRKISQRSAQRWIATQITLHTLVRTDRGHYRKPDDMVPN